MKAKSSEVIEHFHVEEISEGEFKGQVCLKIYCSKEMSKILMGYLGRIMDLGQSALTIGRIIGMH